MARLLESSRFQLDIHRYISIDRLLSRKDILYRNFVRSILLDFSLDNLARIEGYIEISLDKKTAMLKHDGFSIRSTQ